MKKITNLNLILLIITSIFIIPLNSSIVFSETTDKSSTDSDTITSAERQTQVCGNFPPNPKESFILSVMTLCLPGILEKYHEYREFKCQEVVCTYNAVRNNLDPEVCKQIRAYQTCKYFVGEIFAITPAAYLEYWRQAIRNVIANPIGVAYSAAVISARDYMTVACKGTPPQQCTVSRNPLLGGAVLLVVVTDARAVYERVQDIIEGESYLSSISPDSSCDQVIEIKRELEEILRAYEDLEPEEDFSDEEEDN